MAQTVYLFRLIGMLNFPVLGIDEGALDKFGEKTNLLLAGLFDRPHAGKCTFTRMNPCLLYTSDAADD